jgi:branched-chain amino acid transport system permease protein
VHKFGHVPELLVTFGLSYLILELVQLVWGRSTVPYGLPTQLQAAALHAVRHAVPQVAFLHDAGGGGDAAVGVAVAHAHAHRAGDPGGAHAPRRWSRRWATTCRASSCWCSAAARRWPGWPGVVGGNTFVTEPAMAATVGSMIFVVVVVGGMGSLAGAFVASLLIGVLQTFAVAMDQSLATRRSRRSASR